MISDDPPLIFIHIRKAAGQSIKSALDGIASRDHPLCLPRELANPHETAQEFIERIGEAEFFRRKSFCVVRHPLDRFVSQYRFLRKRQDRIPEMGAISSMSRFIEAVQAGLFLTVNHSRGQKMVSLSELTRPQHDYVCCDGQTVSVTMVLRFEAISRDWKDACDVLGLPAAKLPHKNRSPAVDPDDRFAARKFVEMRYQRDYDLFGHG